MDYKVYSHIEYEEDIANLIQAITYYERFVSLKNLFM